MDPTRDFYSFVKLTDLPSSLNLCVRIGSLQGNLARSSVIDLLEHPERSHWGTNIEDHPPFYLTLRLYSSNKPLTPVQRTSYKHFSKSWQWNQPIDLGYPIRELPLDAQLGITIWDTNSIYSGTEEQANASASASEGPSDRVVGGTTLKLFGSKGTLKKAQQRCRVHLGVPTDGSVNTETDSKLQAGQLEGSAELARLEKLIKRHERADIPHLKWLDKQTYRVIEGIHARETESIPNQLWLYVDLPRFEWPLVWCEEEATAPTSIKHRGFGGPRMPSTSADIATAASTTHPGLPTTATSAATAQGTLQKPGNASAPLIDRSLFTLPDPEAQRENPIEAKHRRLVRAQRSRQRGMASAGGAGGLMTPANLALARNLKPDKKARDEIEDILSSPPTRELTDQESDLLWTYRFYLSRSPRGLTKFLKAVSWNDQVESRVAIEQVLPLWSGTNDGSTTGMQRSQVEIGDVLELLGPSCRMMHKAVRQWAVERLAERDDEELGLYLLQLVQALKLDEKDGEADKQDIPSEGQPNSEGTSTKASVRSRSLGPLTDFLISRSLATVERSLTSSTDSLSSSASLLYNFWWYLSVECSDERWAWLYKRIRTRLQRSLQDLPTPAGRRVLEDIRRQERMVGRLSEIARSLKASKDARPKKIEKLKEALRNQATLGLDTGTAISKGDHQGDENHHHAASQGKQDSPGLPLPLDPIIRTRKILTDKCSVFKSNLYPLLIYFETCSDEFAAPPSEYALIFKSGDDLRQDQLVLQLFQLMDRLLLNENLDLKLMPYRVLATSAREGMVQFVPSRTLANIMSEWGSLAEYLKSEQNATGGNNGEVSNETMDRFVRSCAGYCVVTYLLGVGDRHLDNLLLTSDGRFFHVDFGYILNRDPKPFPPPVKVAKEMVDCMGGASSANYARFRQLCFTAFSILRKNSGLILNLIGLMVDANVGDIKVEPDKAVGKVLEKFRLDLSESDARAYFDDLLQQSSYLTVVFDRLHDAAQFFRS